MAKQAARSVDRVTVKTAMAPRPSGQYSQAVRHGDVLYLSGQGPLGTDGAIVQGDTEVQLRQCIANLEAVAAEAGTSLRHALRVGVFLSPRADRDVYNRVFAELFAGSQPPARTTVYSLFPNFDIEVDAIVAVPRADE